MFNSERWIERTLASVIAQTHKHWECLIVDDGSTDNSSYLVQRVIEKHPRLRIFLKKIPNSGVSVARNSGIESAQGKYVAFLDSDDFWDPDKLDAQVKFLTLNENIGAVLCDFYISKSQNDGNLRKRRLILQDDSKSIARRWLSLEGNGAFLSSTILIRRNVLEGSLRFDKKLSLIADLYFFLQLVQITKVDSIPMALVQYRQHDSQMHLNPNNLKAEWKVMLNQLEVIPPPLTKALLQANVLVMSFLLNFKNGKTGAGVQDLASAFRIRPLSIVTLPLYILSKRVRSSLARIIGR